VAMAKSILILIFILVFLVILVFVIRGFFRRTDNQARYPKKGVPGKKPEKPYENPFGHILITEPQKMTFPETTPILKKIHYTPLIQGPFPTFTHNMDETLLRNLIEKISDQKMIHLDHHTLLNFLKDVGSNPSKISSLILTNPDLSAKILQTVNSAYFGFPEKIISVGRAITLLGYSNVRTIVFQDYLNAIVPKDWQGEQDFSLKIGVHSACVSVCAAFLDKEYFQIPGYDFGAIGLLHDIGKYFLAGIEVKGTADPNLPGLLQEEEVYGINHPLLGSIIAEKWDFSDLIINGIRYHHHPFYFNPEDIPEGCLKASFVLALADLITKALGYPGNEYNNFLILDIYFQKFGISQDLNQLITPFLVKEMNKACNTVLSYSQHP
jgi:hypothetical protein